MNTYKQAWAILPEALNTLCKTIESISGDPLCTNKLNQAGSVAIATSKQDHTAIIPITGPIVRYSDLFAFLLGATSIDQIQSDLQRAITDPVIRNMILHIDSPGGTVAGVHELANIIAAAKSIKPITAYVSSLGASAAYWLASSADEIVIDATAAVGSIGVISTIIDDSERKTKAGINEITIVSSHSPNKHLDASTDNGRLAIQSLVDSIADVFVADVARNRGVSTETVLSDFGQGGLLVGKAAVQAGLADRLGSLSEVIQSLTSRGKATMNKSETIEASSQPIAADAPMAAITLEFITSQYPSITNALRLEGAQLERERIQAVEEQLIPGYEALINQLKYDGKTTGVEAAVKVLAAEKQQRVQILNDLKEASHNQVTAVDSLASDSNKPLAQAITTEEQLAQEWLTSPVLQEEFISQATYIAYRQAESKGLVKVIAKAS
jgi:signal peptide peptidase SppA